MAEALAKPGVNSLELSYSGTSPYAYDVPIDISIFGFRIQLQAEIEDVTAGIDTSRRLAKTGLVNGRIVVNGYMTATSFWRTSHAINSETDTGRNILIKYGDRNRQKTFVGILENMEVNSNKTSAFVSVAFSFRLAGMQNDDPLPDT